MALKHDVSTLFATGRDIVVTRRKYVAHAQQSPQPSGGREIPSYMNKKLALV